MENVFIVQLEIFLKNLFWKKVILIGLMYYLQQQNNKNNRVYTSTKLTPIQASLKKNEGFAYKNLLDKRKKINRKFQVDDLVRTADLKRTFSISDTTNWSYKLYKITEINNDTIPSLKKSTI